MIRVPVVVVRNIRTVTASNRLRRLEMKKIIVAIDGQSSCGKSTMAKVLAQAVHYTYVDTGAMYRAVTLYALRNGFVSSDGSLDEERLRRDIEEGNIQVSFSSDNQVTLNGEPVEKYIRGLEVSAHVSTVAAIPFVRSFLVAQQQTMGEQKGIVMDGRDIGSTVFPHAELKVFVQASAEVRAQRRYDELVAKGDKGVKYDDILRNVQERDYVDSHRAVSPLRPTSDALILDNSHLSREEQNEWLLKQFHLHADC